MTTAGRVAWSIWAVSVASLAAAVGLALLSGAAIPPEEWVFVLLLPAFVIASATVGALVASRHPRNAIGWIFLATGLSWGLSQPALEVARFASTGGIAVTTWVLFLDWLGSWLFTAGIYLPATFGFLLFPDGHLPSRRWRPIAWIAGVGLAGILLENAFAPGPLEDAAILRSNPYSFGPAAFWEVVSVVLSFSYFAILGSVAALLVRLRRASGETRQQIKWLAYSAAVALVVFTLVFAMWGLFPDDPTVTIVGQALILLVLLLIPVAAGIAILRRRLYDIDVVINRTLLFGLLAAFITAVYLAIVVGIGAALGGGTNPFLAVLATAVVAVAFQPLRERARRVANRLVYGKRATPYEVLSELADRLGESYSVEDVTPRMARILAEGTGAARGAVWLQVGNELRVAAAWPADGETGAAVVPLHGEELPQFDDGSVAVPVRHRGELLGAITLLKARGESLLPTEEKLLRDVASQAGLVLRNVRLVEELRGSRQRLVAAQDEERRRLERNLHDGAQQQLVALSVKLRLVESMAAKDAARAGELARQANAEAQAALDDLRDLARGIYPPLLADKGLAAALDAQLRKAPLPVTLAADGVGRYPAEAEASVYFSVLEALQNVAKYADASSVRVRLWSEGGELRFSVEDDGRGFDPGATKPGMGLRNMRDRIEALGGSMEIRSRPGAGTTVAGRIPSGAGG